jgi:hypothetical protein
MSETIDLRSIPEGTYRCRVAEVREGYSRKGAIRWNLRFEVADGEYGGRTATWHVIEWSEEGIRAARATLTALGMPFSAGHDDLESRDLLWLTAACRLSTERREAANGKEVLRLVTEFVELA